MYIDIFKYTFLKTVQKMTKKFANCIILDSERSKERLIDITMKFFFG